MKPENNTRRLVVFLIIVILLLLGFIAYIFVVKPGINAYVVQKQSEAIDSVITLMFLQIQQQGYTQVQSTQFNQSVILVPYIPPAQEQQEQQTA